MIQARIRKAFSGGLTLDVELQAAGGVTVLFGPGGAGKTATLEALAGLIKPDQGRVLIGDRILYDSGAGVDLPARLRPCAYLPGGLALFPHMTLRENLVFAAAARRLARLERHRRVNELIERFALRGVSDRRPAQVSGEERLRCAVARALVAQPDLLLVDGPLRAEMHPLLRRVRVEFDVAMLVATSELEDCLELGDEMLVFSAGRVIQSGRPCEVIERPETVEAARLLGNFNLLPAEISALDPAGKSSRVRLGEAELAGPYFPGRFRGDRVTLCVRRDQLLALPATGRPGSHQVAARLLHVVERPGTVCLHFDGEIVAELSRAEFEQRKHARDWVVEFPPACLRAL
ncbi:MAG: ATP-binding cassette domain-containing protein [Bryobacteraceae bacterium]